MTFPRILLALLALSGLTRGTHGPHRRDVDAQHAPHLVDQQTCQDMADDQACLAGQLQNYMDGLDRRDGLPFLIARGGVPANVEVHLADAPMIKREEMERDGQGEDHESVDPMFTNSRNGRGRKRDDDVDDDEDENGDNDQADEQFTNSRNGKGWKRDDDPEAQFTNSRGGRGWKRDEGQEEDEDTESGPDEQFTNSRTGKGFKRDDSMHFGVRWLGEEARE